MDLPSVSILTVTQGSRVSFLKIQVESLAKQTYKNIAEWVIVNGSKNEEESQLLHAEIDGWRFGFPVKVAKPNEWGSRIGHLRNVGNNACTADVIVCMDDDDYYPPRYVEHAVECLKPPYQVAGCANLFVYDLRWGLLVQSKPAEQNYTTNNCLAYRKEYLWNHRYDNSARFDEESSFLGIPPNSMKASVQIAQMDPRKAPLHMIHTTNTANKARAVLSAIYDAPYCCVRTHENIGNLISAYTLDRYRECLGPKKDCEYDIVYVCGMWSVTWDPSSESLGGSEQSVVHLSREWARLGLKVAVYGEIPERVIDGVRYFPFHRFDPYQRFKTLVLWRYYGANPFASCASVVETDHMLVDLHDNNLDIYKPCERILQRYPRARLCFKSRFHHEQYMRIVQRREPLPEDQKVILWNGIQVDLFRHPKMRPDCGRSQFRICYTSCYTRGLAYILKHFWPIVQKLEPRAELHLYYGMEYVVPEEAKMIQELISKSMGVCDHGRKSIHMVAREKHMSTFHLYLTENTSEIDCISVRESLVAGCIPVILDMGVFRERDGFRIPIGTTIPESARMLVDLIGNPAQCAQLRTKLSASPTISSWEQVAKEWLKLLQ